MDKNTASDGFVWECTRHPMNFTSKGQSDEIPVRGHLKRGPGEKGWEGAGKVHLPTDEYQPEARHTHSIISNNGIHQDKIQGGGNNTSTTPMATSSMAPVTAPATVTQETMVNKAAVHEATTPKAAVPKVVIPVIPATKTTAIKQDVTAICVENVLVVT